MTLYKNKYRIETTRLQTWDYSAPAYYFITMNTKNREWLFGEIIDGKMNLSKYGEIVNECWHDLPNHYFNIILDEFIIMPDHVHGIMVIPDDTPSPTKTGKKRHGLFEFVRAFKTFSARRINQLRGTPGIPVWQPRFHDRVIRDHNELFAIQEYIINNPRNWNRNKNIFESGELEEQVVSSILEQTTQHDAMEGETQTRAATISKMETVQQVKKGNKNERI